MTTLHEERGQAMSPVEDGDEDETSDKEVDTSDGTKTLTPKTIEGSPRSGDGEESVEEERKTLVETKEEWKDAGDARKITTSRTLDSLSDIQGTRMGTPSTSSSGYGSTAVSTSNLLSEDSLSIRSISVDDSPEGEKCYLAEETTLAGGKAKPEDVPSVNCGQTTVSRAGEQGNSEQRKYLSVEERGDGGTSSKSVSGDESPNEGSSVVSTKLPPGKVVRRKKTSTKATSNGHRASFPMVAPVLSDSKTGGKLLNGSESVERLDEVDMNVPEWVVVGESVLIRPYNTSGVVAFLGLTEFAPGVWVGVELDAPTGKNDGVVQGVQYFSCKPKHGIFVRADKLILDKRGRAMRQYKNMDQAEGSLRRSTSRGLEVGVIACAGRPLPPALHVSIPKCCYFPLSRRGPLNDPQVSEPRRRNQLRRAVLLQNQMRPTKAGKKGRGEAHHSKNKQSQQIEYSPSSRFNPRTARHRSFRPTRGPRPPSPTSFPFLHQPLE